MDAAAFWLAVLQIIFINVLLSGDNAVVIAMACRSLPAEQRRWGVVIGAGVAVILRIVFVGVIAQLMLLPYLKLVGGAALLVIAAKLVVPDDPDKDEIQAAAHLWRAVMIIVVADIVMSLDNIIAIAAIAQGDLLLHHQFSPLLVPADDRRRGLAHSPAGSIPDFEFADGLGAGHDQRYGDGETNDEQ